MQLQLFKHPVQLCVRRGVGCIYYHEAEPVFTDQVEVVDRVPREHSGWQSIRYNKQRYQLFGGIRTPFFICLNSPIVGTD